MIRGLDRQDRRRKWRYKVLITPIKSETRGCNVGLVAAKRIVQDKGPDFMTAAEILGGPAALRRCARVFSDIKTAGTLSRRMKRELVWLHRLLTLDLGGDPVSMDAACFAAIEPDDPRVHGICRAADFLDDLLVEIAADNPACDIIPPWISPCAA
ncbi:hypothetical protein OCH239_13770 [Roseivivax halodurans JCM 10272]|uniref:Uncharacterized protein n=1 Tax=Roseivivax halodurans JCM 10272 TaxID=1449350 RepID=X7EK48_9RHOB|nr:hypothetical protein [Roseivivax halodurans]ETX15518.1 hypothetical protein OCH239_13770 [Roseivivax halodurans JCM 10272]